MKAAIKYAGLGFCGGFGLILTLKTVSSLGNNVLDAATLALEAGTVLGVLGFVFGKILDAPRSVIRIKISQEEIKDALRAKADQDSPAAKKQQQQPADNQDERAVDGWGLEEISSELPVLQQANDSVNEEPQASG